VHPVRSQKYARSTMSLTHMSLNNVVAAPIQNGGCVRIHTKSTEPRVATQTVKSNAHDGLGALTHLAPKSRLTQSFPEERQCRAERETCRPPTTRLNGPEKLVKPPGRRASHALTFHAGFSFPGCRPSRRPATHRLAASFLHGLQSFPTAGRQLNIISQCSAHRFLFGCPLGILGTIHS